jgi:alpha-acetolactate decarboxylase
MPPETRSPFVIVTSMHHPVSRRVQDISRNDLISVIDEMAEDARGIVAVRVEGDFDSVLIRSVPPQEPPYRPYVEVCASDEVRWTKEPFAGVFVGFKFPDLAPGATIPGLHLHGLNHERTTGGHNHDLHIRDAVVTIDITREMVMHLPDKSMADLLNTPRELREVQRSLLRDGSQTTAALAARLSISVDEASERISWLADRGFVAQKETPHGELWSIQLKAQTAKKSPFMSAILDAL